MGEMVWARWCGAGDGTGDGAGETMQGGRWCRDGAGIVRSNVRRAATTTDRAKPTLGLLRQTLILATGSRSSGNPRRLELGPLGLQCYYLNTASICQDVPFHSLSYLIVILSYHTIWLHQGLN